MPGFRKWFRELRSGSTDSGNHHSPKFFLPNEAVIDHVDKCAVERIHYGSIAKVTAVIDRHVSTTSLGLEGARSCAWQNLRQSSAACSANARHAAAHGYTQSAPGRESHRAPGSAIESPTRSSPRVTACRQDLLEVRSSDRRREYGGIIGRCCRDSSRGSSKCAEKSLPGKSV